MEDDTRCNGFNRHLTNTHTNTHTHTHTYTAVATCTHTYAQNMAVHSHTYAQNMAVHTHTHTRARARARALLDTQNKTPHSARQCRPVPRQPSDAPTTSRRFGRRRARGFINALGCVLRAKIRRLPLKLEEEGSALHPGGFMTVPVGLSLPLALSLSLRGVGSRSGAGARVVYMFHCNPRYGRNPVESTGEDRDRVRILWCGKPDRRTKAAWGARAR